MSEWRYHLLLRLGVMLKRAGNWFVDTADFNPCTCERARIDALIKEHGVPTRGPSAPITVSTTPPSITAFTASASTTYYLHP